MSIHYISSLIATDSVLLYSHMIHQSICACRGAWEWQRNTMHEDCFGFWICPFERWWSSPAWNSIWQWERVIVSCSMVFFWCPPCAKDFSALLHGCHFRELILDIIKEGRIVPSEITVELIRKAMEMKNPKRVLIDGFPRCEENRIAFERIVSLKFDSVHCITLIAMDSLLTNLVGNQIQAPCGPALLSSDRTVFDDTAHGCESFLLY